MLRVRNKYILNINWYFVNILLYSVLKQTSQDEFIHLAGKNKVSKGHILKS